MARSSSLKDLQSFIGMANFASIVNPLLKAQVKHWSAYLRRFPFKKTLQKSLKRPAFRFAPIRTPPSLSRQIRRNIQRICLKRAISYVIPQPSLDLFTDASNLGWGYHTSTGIQNKGSWPAKFVNLHINVLEIIVVYLALKKISLPQFSTIRLFSDNKAVVHILSRGGSAKSHLLNSWMVSIAILLVQRNLFLEPNHIAGRLNSIADALSRPNPIPTEWTLDKSSFQHILLHFPHLQVDLFATRLNHQLPMFVSPLPDHLAIAQDAMVVDWNKWQSIYLFPPVNLLRQVLVKLKSFKGLAVVVAPEWRKSPWFPLLQNLCWKFPLHNPLLFQRVSNKTFYGPLGLTKHLHA